MNTNFKSKNISSEKVNGFLILLIYFSSKIVWWRILKKVLLMEMLMFVIGKIFLYRKVDWLIYLTNILTNIFDFK